MKKPISHIVDYLILSLLVSVAVILVLIHNGNKQYQQYIIIGLSMLYVLWGYVHHQREKTYQPKIILEYVLFALLGCILIIGLLK